MSPFGPLAEWQDRLVSGLIDWLGPYLIAYFLNIFVGVGVTGFRFSGSRLFLGWGLYLLAFAWTLYQGSLAGTTGQSMGMKQSGLRLVGEQNGQPIGSSQGIVRNLLFLPGFFCCGLLTLIDSLFPLWDPKKQTLRDKIAKSVVIKTG
ncbi:hypothetical protein BH10ACT1_BH10ACT1_42450 [soil metagenome]